VGAATITLIRGVLNKDSSNEGMFTIVRSVPVNLHLQLENVGQAWTFHDMVLYPV